MKVSRWEARSIATLGIVVFLLLAMGGRADASIRRVDPAEANWHCSNFISDLTLVVNTTGYQPAVAGAAIERIVARKQGGLSKYMIALLSRGEDPYDVYPYAFSLCVAKYGELA